MGRQYTAPTIVQAIQTLGKAHPALFNLEKPVPLQCGIRKELRTMYPGLPGSFLTAILGYYSSRPAYLEACHLNAPRYGFSGQQGEVNEREARYASNRLFNIRRSEERKRAKEAA